MQVEKLEPALTHEQFMHLRHMTDGRWHDDCHWCRHRRVHGGTGLELDGIEQPQEEK